MFPSPAPSPSPSPGPAYLYLNSHHNNSGAVGGGSNAGGGANGFGPPPPPNGNAGFGLPRFPQQQQAATLGGWGPRSHHQHQQNPSLSSLPGSLAHSSAASSLSGPNGGPSSPGGFAALHHPAQHHHPHHHPHASHTPSNLSHMPSPGALNNTTAPHYSSSGSSSNTMGGAGGAGGSGFSPHWQQQLLKAEVSGRGMRGEVAVGGAYTYPFTLFAHRSHANPHPLTTTQEQQLSQRGVQRAPRLPFRTLTRAPCIYRRRRPMVSR